MKTCSKSKLLVVFVIVFLLSLPYVFAGKPEKTGKPEPKSEPIWSAYIPVDIQSGIQGALNTPKVSCPSDDCPDGLLNGEYYVYDENESGGTRHNVWTGDFFNTREYSTIFRFQILFGTNSSWVKLGIPDASCVEGYPTMDCELLSEQPSVLLPDFMFAFWSFNGYEFEAQEPWDEPISLARGNLYIDNYFDASSYTYMDYIRGKLLKGNLTVERTDIDAWHISFTPCNCTDPNLGIEMQLWDEENEDCTPNPRKHRPDICSPALIEEAAGDFFINSFDIYFVRTIP